MPTSSTVDLSETGPSAGLDILILDDNDVDRQRMRRILAQAGIKATVMDCDSIQSFSDALSATFYDAVLIDYRLGLNNGIEAVGILRNHRAQRQAAAIMVTGDQRIDLAVEAMRIGCDDFVIKAALDPQRIRSSLAKAISRRKSEPASVSPGPSRIMALRDAVERQTAEMSVDLRRSINAVVARTRSLREAYGADARVLAEIAHIDAACARAWQRLTAHESSMTALDLTKPPETRLGLRNRRLN